MSLVESERMKRPVADGHGTFLFHLRKLCQ